MMTKHAWFTYRLGNTEQAREMLQQSIARLREQDAPLALIEALWAYASASWFAGDLEASSLSAQEGLAMSRALGLGWYAANLLIYLGVVALDRGDDAKAHVLLKAGLASSRATGDPRLICFAASFLSRTSLAMQMPEETLALLNETLGLATETGDRSGIGLILERLAYVAGSTGDTQEAYRLLERTIHLYEEIGDAWSQSRTLNQLGQYALGEGDVTRARQCFSDAFSIALQARALANAIDALVSLAALAAGSNEHSKALHLLYPILQHPAASQDARARAQRLLAEQASSLQPPRLQAIEASARGRSLEDLLATLNADPLG
jgi:tetratricopeptide (TPR) repeat protein